MSNAMKQEMQTLYKLTDENGKTMTGKPQETQWGENVTHTAKGSQNQDLCSNGWIHAYSNPYLAILLNPIHANIKNPRLWEAEGIVGKSDNGLKVGCRTLTTVRELSIPILTMEQKIEFAIRCALQVTKNSQWECWAKNWLSGKDRTERAAEEAARAAAWAAAWAAKEAARAAAWAARAAEVARAEWPEWAEAAKEAARAAARAAAWAAKEAARAAAWAACAAAREAQTKDGTLLTRILIDMKFDV